MKAFAKLYYKKSLLPYLLLPIAGIYSLIIKLRLLCYQKKIFKSYRPPVPVIVVGNLTLGGTGKTPLTIALIELLRTQGFKPGVVSRGYGSKAAIYPYSVHQSSDAHSAGDEPLLIYSRTRAPVVIDANRSRAVQYLLQQHDCNVIIADDGLQHYALARDIEIAVIDAERKFGNGLLFPAGPLRESKKRLETVNFLILNGAENIEDLASYTNKTYPMFLEAEAIKSIAQPEKSIPLEFFQNKPLIAMAGIGNPDRFFQTLQQLGLQFKKHPLPDHYGYSAADFAENHIYLMTEKDAVKCHNFKFENLFVLPVQAKLSLIFQQKLFKLIAEFDCDSQH